MDEGDESSFLRDQLRKTKEENSELVAAALEVLKQENDPVRDDLAGEYNIEPLKKVLIKHGHLKEKKDGRTED